LMLLSGKMWVWRLLIWSKKCFVWTRNKGTVQIKWWHMVGSRYIVRKWSKMRLISPVLWKTSKNSR
jgi:hypothetical protein